MDFVLGTLIVWGIILGPLAYISKFIRNSLVFSTYGASRFFLVALVVELLAVLALSSGFTDFINLGQVAVALFSAPGWFIATKLIGMETRIVGGNGSGFIPPGVIEFPLPMLGVIFILNLALGFVLALILDWWLSRGIQNGNVPKL